MDSREGMAASGHSLFFTQGGFGIAPQYVTPFSTTNRSLPLPAQSSNTSEGFSDDSAPPEDFSPPFPAYGCSSGGRTGGAMQGEAASKRKGKSERNDLDGDAALMLVASPDSCESGMQKRRRGRPPGSGTKQQLASYGEWFSSSAGMGFMPHAIEISPGEDMAAKIMSFSQLGPRAICIMSGTGVISSVTLRQPDTCGGTVTYEGRFEILCLSGSYFLADYGSSRGRTGGLSITLSSQDGRVIGGAVGGQLIAASHVQVMVGSFVYGGSKVRSKRKPKPKANLPGDPDSMLGGPSLNEGSQPVGVAWPTPKEIFDENEGHIDINQIHS